jgi:hypothetical protein
MFCALQVFSVAKWGSHWVVECPPKILFGGLLSSHRFVSSQGRRSNQIATKPIRKKPVIPRESRTFCRSPQRSSEPWAAARRHRPRPAPLIQSLGRPSYDNGNLILDAGNDAVTGKQQDHPVSNGQETPW